MYIFCQPRCGHRKLSTGTPCRIYFITTTNSLNRDLLKSPDAYKTEDIKRCKVLFYGRHE